MIGAVWGSGVDVAGDQATIAANKRWQSKLFTTSGTWTVPADVGVIWVDGCAGGGGGGGGYGGTGGGGSGGTPGYGCRNRMIAVTPNDLITVTIGSAGPGGAVNTDGGVGGSTTLIGISTYLSLSGTSNNGKAGVVDRGGYGRGAYINPTQSMIGISGSFSSIGVLLDYFLFFGSSGGAISADGTPSFNVGSISPQVFAGTGTASGGGGGGGGGGVYGDGGNGGNALAAGDNATGYGAGGGGGGGNAAGGNGSPGMIRIYAFSATTI